MLSTPLLIWVLVVESVVIAGALMLLFGHGVWLWWYGTRRQALLPRARAMLTAALDGAPLTREQRGWWHTLPVPLQIRFCVALAPSLGGAQRQRLVALAQETGLIACAEARCRSRLWWRRLQGARLLTLLGGDAEVLFRLLQDREAVVRAQAARYAVEHPSPAVIASMLTLLADANGLCCATAQDTLIRLGSPVVEPLASVLASHSGPQVEAALVVAIGLAEPRFLAPALHLCRHQAPSIRALAATLLGALGGSEGVKVLHALLADAVPEVRASAARALGRLGQWPAASALALMLRDRAWVVRREAARALRTLGAPGALFLRRCLTDEDHFAADMARQVLALPDTAGLGMALREAAL